VVLECPENLVFLGILETQQHRLHLEILVFHLILLHQQNLEYLDHLVVLADLVGL
jgi:hypothetical protein